MLVALTIKRHVHSQVELHVEFARADEVFWIWIQIAVVLYLVGVIAHAVAGGARVTGPNGRSWVCPRTVAWGLFATSLHELNILAVQLHDMNCAIRAGLAAVRFAGLAWIALELFIVEPPTRGREAVAASSGIPR
jgi:hypothetical protein